MANKIYGYARISTKEQSIDRQIRNIKEQYPTATIIQEEYTGTKTEGRDKFKRLLKLVKAGDTIIFDSVSRMSRNAEEGVEQYMELFNREVNLVFLKEPTINTDTYRQAVNREIAKADDRILDIVNKFLAELLAELQREQIVKAFQQAEKEVLDLRKRTAEGLVTAKLNGKKVGREQGDKLVTKKSIKAKQDILKYSKRFNGIDTDRKVMEIAGISKDTFYKYLKQLQQEQE